MWNNECTKDNLAPFSPAPAAGAWAPEVLRATAAQRRRGAGAVVTRARGVGPDDVLDPPEGAPEVGGRRVREEAAATRNGYLANNRPVPRTRYPSAK